MAYPTDRTEFIAWVKQNADDNAYGDIIGSDDKIDVIIDALIGPFSEVSPLLSVGLITISSRYAVLMDDWVDGPAINTEILCALQSGQNPELIGANQSSIGYTNRGGQIRFSNDWGYGSGYGLGSGGSVIQDPIEPSLPAQPYPESSSALIDGVQKNVFILPSGLFSTGQSFTVTYAALHKIQDQVLNDDDEIVVPKLQTIPKKDLLDFLDFIFSRAAKGRVFGAITANEAKGEDIHDIGKLNDLSKDNPLTKRFNK